MELASAPDNDPLPLAVIAQHQNIKLKYLEQIFIRLHHAGLVRSRKGPGGGYTIARDPQCIKLSEVLHAVGESTAPVLCAVDQKDKYCAGVDSCPLQRHWQKLKNHIDTFFEGLSVGDLCRDKKKAKKKTKGRLYDKG